MIALYLWHWLFCLVVHEALEERVHLGETSALHICPAQWDAGYPLAEGRIQIDSGRNECSVLSKECCIPEWMLNDVSGSSKADPLKWKDTIASMSYLLICTEASVTKYRLFLWFYPKQGFDYPQLPGRLSPRYYHKTDFTSRHSLHRICGQNIYSCPGHM